MKSIKFTELVPEKYFGYPKEISEDNDFTMLINDLCALVSQSNVQRKPNQSDTQYIASVIDSLDGTREWNDIKSRLDNISGRMSKLFADAFDIILDRISPKVQGIMHKVEKRAKEKRRKLDSYFDHGPSGYNSGTVIHMLDVEELYRNYRSSAQEFANQLCHKYNYNVQYLNDKNITGLIARMGDIVNVPDMDNYTIEAMMKDIVVEIASKGGDDVVINTNEPDSVSVDGATKNVTKEDDQSSSSADDGITYGGVDHNDYDDDGSSDDDFDEDSANAEADELDDDDGDNEYEVDDDLSNGEASVKTSGVNVVVKSDNTDAKVTTRINDEVVEVNGGVDDCETEKCEESNTPTEEDKTLAMAIVRACTSEGGLDYLKSLLFAPYGHVQAKHLLATLKFVSKNIRKAVLSTAENHVSWSQYRLIENNLDAITELQKAGVMYLDINMARHANTLMLGTNLINKNVYNKARRSGVPVLNMIKNYLRVNHNTDTNDIYYNYMSHAPMVHGLTMEALATSMMAVEQKLSDTRNALKDDYTKKIAGIRKATFLEVMAEEVKREAAIINPDRQREFIVSAESRIIPAVEKYSTDRTTNLEDVVYNFIIDSWYKGTVVEKVYRQLKDRIQIGAAHEALSPSNLAMMKMETIAQLSADFIYDKLVYM